MSGNNMVFYVSAILVLIIALLVDIAHSWARTGLVASVTEALGKLLVGSALSLSAAGLLSRGSPVYNPGYLVLLVIVSFFILIVIFIQAFIYRVQRERTRVYLKELVKKAPRTKVVADSDIQVITDVLAEIVDADFVPESFGNKLSGMQRSQVREMAARWLNTTGIDVTATDLLVPEAQRVYDRIYQILGVCVILASLFYIVVFILTSDPPKNNP